MKPIYFLSILLLACGGGGSGSGAAEPATTAEPAPDAEPEAPAPVSAEKVKIVNEPGQYVALEDILVPGVVTVIDFYADWCGACHVMEEKLLEATADEPRIVLRKINIADTDTDVARRYDIGPLPHLRIYGPDGKLAHILVGNQALQAANLSRELL
jgi:thiol:disulfide interchange protein